MSKILITGAAGLLGQNLIRQLESDHTILAIDIAPEPFEATSKIDYQQVDLTDFQSVRSDLIKFKPDFIFNCAAFTDVDRCESERELADKLNYELVNHLLGVGAAKFIHYSSDYVFDGTSGPYSEDDLPEPINYYGLTKFHSENILQHSGRSYLIIRTNVLYGQAKSVKKDFVSWVKESLKHNHNISVVEDQYNNPTSAFNLAEASIEAVSKDLHGIIHIAGDDYLSRYEASLVIAKHYHLDTDLITRVKTENIPQKARRPHLGGLKIERAKKILDVKLLGLNNGLLQLEQV